MRRIAVVIPSRAGSRQSEFLDRSIKSAVLQNDWHTIVKIFVGIDHGSAEPRISGVTIVEASGAGQAAALNAAAAKADADFIAFLEDDDIWAIQRCSVAISTLDEGAAFTSSTQLEVTALLEGWSTDYKNIVRVNDFPTPSGWLMPMSTWQKVGPFDESFRYHLDNEWLGRLTRTGLRRVHLVESTAPIGLETCERVRPWLANCIHNGSRSVAERVQLKRHSSPLPLVTKLVHADSGMSAVADQLMAQQQSTLEYNRLARMYGKIPW